MTFDEIKFNSLSASYFDFNFKKPLQLKMGPIYLQAKQISTKLSEDNELKELNIQFGDGSLALSGKTYINPVSIELNYVIKNIPIDFVNSFLAESTNLEFKKGSLDSKGQISYTTDEINVKSDLLIHQAKLDTINTHETAFTWNQLSLSGLNYRQQSNEMNITEVNLSQFSTTVILNKDGTVNVQDYFSGFSEKSNLESQKNYKNTDLDIAVKEKKPEENHSGKNTSFRYHVDQFKIDQSQIDYADLSLKPQFKVKIHKLSGQIAPVTSRLNEKMTINLSGIFENHGRFKSNGFISNLDRGLALDLGMSFNNIEMTTFTPYSGKFAGYEIEKGKMNLDFKYKLNGNRIKGQNKLFLDQFTLGKKVDQSKYPFLPIRLAVALIQDRNGHIKMSLPVEGNVKDPEFSYGGIIWQALKNVIINIVAAPFDFFKDLLGDTKAASTIFFEATQSDLSEAEKLKIANLSKVLIERPRLALDIQGSYSDRDIQISKEKNKKELTEDELRQLAIIRAQKVQDEFIRNNILAERLFILSSIMIHEDPKPKTILKLKER